MNQLQNANVRQRPPAARPCFIAHWAAGGPLADCRRAAGGLCLTFYLYFDADPRLGHGWAAGGLGLMFYSGWRQQEMDRITSTNVINEKTGSICVPNEMPPKPGKGWHGYQLGAGDKEDLAVVVC